MRLKHKYLKYLLKYNQVKTSVVQNIFQKNLTDQYKYHTRPRMILWNDENFNGFYNLYFRIYFVLIDHLVSIVYVWMYTNIHE